LAAPRLRPLWPRGAQVVVQNMATAKALVAFGHLSDNCFLVPRNKARPASALLGLGTPKLSLYPKPYTLPYP